MLVFDTMSILFTRVHSSSIMRHVEKNQLLVVFTQKVVSCLWDKKIGYTFK